MTDTVTKPDNKNGQTRHVSSKATQGILEAAAQYPLPIDEILIACDLDIDALSDIDGRITHNQFCRLWQEFVSRSGNPCIGLSLIKFAKPATYDVLGYIAYSSSNVGEALVRLTQYIKILHLGTALTLEVNNQVAHVTHTLIEHLMPTPAAFDQWVIATLVQWIKLATGTDWTPQQVRFEHIQPDSISLYQEFFRAPLMFKQPANELIFDADQLDLPIQEADNSLCEMLERYAQEKLSKLPHSKSFLDNVRHIIIQKLGSGEISLAKIAKALGYAPRTLQRKLGDADVSYQQLLDEIRQELSIHYLGEGQIAISEVAFLLGFSEASAFHRAFRRWTGTSPREFRHKSGVVARIGVAERV